MRLPGFPRCGSANSTPELSRSQETLLKVPISGLKVPISGESPGIIAPPVGGAREATYSLAVPLIGRYSPGVDPLIVSQLPGFPQETPTQRRVRSAGGRSDLGTKSSVNEGFRWSRTVSAEVSDAA